jgi:hypothetical protein
MRPINPLLCLAVGMIATGWAGESRSAENIDALPKELIQQIRMNCTAKPGDSIEITVQCYYGWLQLEIRRNQKIRELIGQGLEHWAVEIMGATYATDHFSQAHKSWLEYGQMHCEMLPLDISQNKSRNANIISSGCWLELYASYSDYLLERYNQLALEEYSREERLK